MKKVCYIIEMNSSVDGMLERLERLGAQWNFPEYEGGEDYLEIEITAPENVIPAVENEIAWFV